MDTVEKILNLMNEKKITAMQLHFDCGLSNNAITKWKNGLQKPSAEALHKIADYFDVSVDYLLGRVEQTHTNNIASHRTKKVEILLDTIKDFDDSDMEYINGVITTYKDLKNKKSVKKLIK